MNTSIYIPPSLADRLETYLDNNRIAKNRFFVEAIEHELKRREEKGSWHPEILNWQGVEGVEDLELDRDFLLPSREDIL